MDPVFLCGCVHFEHIVDVLFILVLRSPMDAKFGAKFNSAAYSKATHGYSEASHGEVDYCTSSWLLSIRRSSRSLNGLQTRGTLLFKSFFVQSWFLNGSESMTGQGD